MTPITDPVQSLAYLVPETALAAGFVATLAWDLFTRGRVRRVGALVLAFASLGVAATASVLALKGEEPDVAVFGGLLASDRYANVFRLLFAAVTAIVLVAAIPTRELRGEGPEEATGGKAGVRGGAGGELVALLLVVCIGMDLMAMARNLLTIYVSIEIVSVVSFILAGYKDGDRKSAEAALKYVVFGGVSSGVMLYGMSWLYGFSRSLSLPVIAERVLLVTREQGHLPNAVVIGAACVLAGFAYKISAVPFHMWAPDVYEGSPTVVAAFFSVGPKAAGFAVLVRFFHDALQAQTAVSGAGSAPWPILGGLLAVATMTVGNLSALEQTNLKRMLAYSSVAHAGYMLLAFTVFTADGIAAIFFYIVAYCSMNLGAFLVVLAVAAKNGGDETLEGIRGLGTRAPAMAIAMTIFLFSLVGLPPFSGFVGKLYIFTALLRAGGAYQGWYWVLAAIGVVNSVVSLAYYARVLRAMYLTPYSTPQAAALVAPLTAEQPTSSPEEVEPLSSAAESGQMPENSTKTPHERQAKVGNASEVSVHKLHGALAAVLVIPTVALGLYWGPLYDFILRSLSMVQ